MIIVLNLRQALMNDLVVVVVVAAIQPAALPTATTSSTSDREFAPLRRPKAREQPRSVSSQLLLRIIPAMRRRSVGNILPTETHIVVLVAVFA